MTFIPVIRMVLRRMAAHWRLEASLFVGLLVAAGVVTSIPAYTGGALQDSLQKEWAEKGYGYPGTYSLNINANPWDRSPDVKEFLSAIAYTRRTVAKRLDFPMVATGWYAALHDPLEIPGPKSDPDDTRNASVWTMTGLNQLVRLVDGRLPRDRPAPDGAVEAACTQAAADELGLSIGRTYGMQSTLMGHNEEALRNEPAPTTKIVFRLVGTFDLRRDALSSPAWIAGPDLRESLYINPRVLMDHLVARQEVNLDGADLTWILDYKRIKISSLPRLIAALNAVERDCRLHDEITTPVVSPVDLLREFEAKKQSLRVMMLALALPPLVLAFYYVVLTAGLLVDQRRGEIAMLRSRGASTGQLVLSFALEWSVLATVCVACGPPLGLALARVMGASAGFLNFVDRRALPVSLGPEAYLYALLLAAAMVVAATVPAARACRHSIVSFKQDQSRKEARPVWQRLYLDFLLVGIGAFGYRTMVLQARAVGESVLQMDRLVDPMLFIVPTLLVTGLGLVLLRVLPLAMGLAERLTARGKGLALHASLLEAARNAGRYRSLVLLVILTTATGIYGAATARTLDQNLHDRAYYAVGADVELKERWYRLKPAVTQGGPPMGPVPMVEDTSRPFEPPFLLHRTAPGVLAAARVQRAEGVPVKAGASSVAQATVLAVDPVEFGRTAWFRRDLLPRHQNVFLNLLTKYPQGAIVSRGIITDNSLKLGDSIAMDLNNQTIEFVIVGAVDYWPTLYPDKSPFVVANLNYVTSRSTIAPYRVWLRLAPGAKLEPILKYLQARNVSVSNATDARRELALARRDPQKMALYGIVSIGFCVAVLLTVIGLILHTLISMRNRLLHFGVLRAIGLSPGQLAGMLGLELAWSVGIGLVMGTLTGQATSEIFVPFMRTAAALAGEVPPFSVVVSGMDIRAIYAVLLPVLLLALAGLTVSLAKLQVHQAIKLGEDG